MVRVAIIGYGVMGSKYTNMITAGDIPNMKLTLVCIRSEKKLDSVRNSISNPSVKVIAGTDELVDSMDLFDAVIITTPHKDHISYAMLAISFGKHVLVEKPSGITGAEAVKITEEAKKAGVLCQVMFHKRTLPYLNKLKEIISSGSIGQLQRISVEATFYRTKHYHNQAMWRSTWEGECGGMLINQGQHVLDALYYIAGMPKEVNATIRWGKYNDFSVDDEASLTFTYDNDVTANVFMSTGEINPCEYIKIVATKGTLIYEKNKITLISHTDSAEYAKISESNDATGVKTNVETMDTISKTGVEYRTMLVNFASAIEDKKPLICPSEDSHAAIMMCNAAYLSAYKHCPVELPCDEAEYDSFLKEMINKEGEGL